MKVVVDADALSWFTYLAPGGVPEIVFVPPSMEARAREVFPDATIAHEDGAIRRLLRATPSGDTGVG